MSVLSVARSASSSLPSPFASYFLISSALPAPPGCAAAIPTTPASREPETARASLSLVNIESCPFCPAPYFNRRAAANHSILLCADGFRAAESAGSLRTSQMLFHLISRDVWKAALAAGTYRPDGD